MGLFDKLYAFLFERDPIVREPIDCGDGLTRLPDADPSSGKIFEPFDNRWMTFGEAAAKTLTQYESGRWFAEGDKCPRCYEISVDGHARALSRNHPDTEARRRWRDIHLEHQGMIRAFGECRCGQNVDPSMALADAIEYNRPYLPYM